MNRMSKSIKNLMTVVLLMAATTLMNAQVLPSLLLNQDPATLAKGSAGVASKAGSFALENNVAAMSFAENKFYGQASSAMWQPNISDNMAYGVGLMYRLNKLGIGLNLKLLQMPAYSGVTSGGSDIRDSKYVPDEFNAALGASYAILDCLSAGVTLRYMTSSLAPEVSGSAFGADIGLYFKKNSLSAGLSVNNLGTKIKYAEKAYAQPALVKAGAAYDLGLGSSALAFSAQVDYLLAGGLMAGAGCEYSFNDMVFARAGYHYGNGAKVLPSYASAGIGLKLWGVILDFTYLFGSKTLGNTMGISLGYTF